MFFCLKSHRILLPSPTVGSWRKWRKRWTSHAGPWVSVGRPPKSSREVGAQKRHFPGRNRHQRDSWKRTMHVTLEGVFDLAEQLLPHLQSRDNNLYPRDLPSNALTPRKHGPQDSEQHICSHPRGSGGPARSVGSESVGNSLNRKSVFLPFQLGVDFPLLFRDPAAVPMP